MSEYKKTEGADSEESFFSVDTNSVNKTKETPEFKGGDYRDPRYFPYLVGELKENFPLTILLISIIGYIIISAFGEMNSNGKYFGYIFFLLISFLLYKLQSLRLKKIHTFFMYGFSILFLIVIIQNIDYIKLFFEYINIWK